MRYLIPLTLALTLSSVARVPVHAQAPVERATRREQLRQLLTKEGPRSDVNIVFRQSTGNE